MKRYERRWREERWYGNGVKYSIHISNSQKLKNEINILKKFKKQVNKQNFSINETIN